MKCLRESQGESEETRFISSGDWGFGGGISLRSDEGSHYLSSSLINRSRLGIRNERHLWKNRNGFGSGQ